MPDGDQSHCHAYLHCDSCLVILVLLGLASGIRPPIRIADRTPAPGASYLRTMRPCLPVIWPQSRQLKDFVDFSDGDGLVKCENSQETTTVSE